MRRTLALTAAVSGVAIASSAFAGFSFTATNTTAGGLPAVLIRAINDGAGTGTQVKALELAYSGPNTIWSVDDTDFNGTPDSAEIAVQTVNTNASFVRVGTGAQTFVVATNPSTGPTEPNPWTSINAFSVTASTTATVPATGAGAVIARFVYPAGTTQAGRLQGQIGGDTGSAIPVDFSWGQVVQNVAPNFVGDPYTLVIDFGNGGPTAGSYSALLASAADADSADVVTITPAPGIPAIFGATSTSGNPANLNIPAGQLTLAQAQALGYDNVNPLVLNYTLTAADNNPDSADDTAQLTIRIVPEPATLGLVAGAGLLALRRRK